MGTDFRIRSCAKEITGRGCQTCRRGAGPRSLAACGAPRRRRRGNSGCGGGQPNSGGPARRRGIVARARPVPGDSAPASCVGYGAEHEPARRAAHYTFDMCVVTPAAGAVRVSVPRALRAAATGGVSPARAVWPRLPGFDAPRAPGVRGAAPEATAWRRYRRCSRARSATAVMAGRRRPPTKGRRLPS